MEVGRDQDGASLVSSTEDSNEPEKNGRTKPVHVWRLFQHADLMDVLMIVAAILVAIGSGIAISSQSFLMGKYFNIFISYKTAQSFSSVAQMFLNGSCSTLAVVELLGNSTNSSDQLFCDIAQEGNVFSSSASYICDPDEELMEQAESLTIQFAILAASAFVANFLTIALWNISAYRQTRRIRIAFYRSLLKHDISWFETTEIAKLGPSFVKGIENIQAGIGDQAGLMIRDISNFVGGMLWAFLLNWKLAIVVSTLLPVVSVLSGLNIKIATRFTEKEERAYVKAGSVAEEILSAIRTVVAFGGEGEAEQRYHTYAKESEKEAIRAAFTGSAALGVLFFFGLSMFGVAFWYGSVLIVDCAIIGGDVFTVVTLVFFGSLCLGGALPQIGLFISASTSAADVFEVIDQAPERRTFGESPETPRGCIQFCNVNFCYPARPNVQVLNGTSFTIEPGQTVAIVGPSGNGKSTILQLVQQFYQHDSGKILLDGINISSIDRDWLRATIGTVTQEPVLFNGSVRENIMLGKPCASEREMIAAAEDANAHTFITELPEGYDTYVGEGGIQLSGGQKQRIAIARALIRNPKILLLDEATSALDTINEKIVQNALDKAKQGRTTLVIAHRLSTVQSADVILCVHKGKIVEKGSHDELLQLKGLYSELVEKQLKEEHNDQSQVTANEAVQAKRKPFVSRAQSLRRSKRGRKERKVVVRSRSGSFKDWVDYNPIHIQEEKCDKTNIEPAEKINAGFFHILKYLKPEWYLVVAGVSLYGVIGACYPIIGALMANVNDVFGESDKETIIEVSRLVCIGFLALSFAAGLFYFAGSFVIKLSGEKLTTRLRVYTFCGMMKKSISWFDEEENTTGSLTTILSLDAKNVKNGTGVVLGIFVLAATSITVGLGVCFSGSWELTLVLFAAIPLLIISHQVEFSMYSGAQSWDIDSLASAANIVMETKNNIKTVISLGAEEYFLNNLTNDLNTHTKNGIKRSIFRGLFFALSASMVLCVYSAGCVLAAYLVTNNRASVGDVLRVFAAVIVTARNVTYALASAPDVSQGFECGKKISSLLKSTNNSIGQKHTKQDVTFGHLVAYNLRFSYPCRPDVSVLQGVSVSVTPGQTLALVGSSGGGKSTLITLIERFYNPTGGAITLDGLNISSFDLKWLRSQIGYVPQEPVLFNTTIADNIRYGALFREVSDEEIVEVAKACNIHDFIQSLPQGYNTNVGFGGSQLSGGQKQRVAIARALLRNPKILLLDEATSSLDAESEQAVQQTLKTARVGRTSIVVAHRLSTIRDADCIAVVQNGQVAESGTHASLMAAKGAYEKLVNFQD